MREGDGWGRSVVGRGGREAKSARRRRGKEGKVTMPWYKNSV